MSTLAEATMWLAPWAGIFVLFVWTDTATRSRRKRRRAARREQRALDKAWR